MRVKPRSETLALRSLAHRREERTRPGLLTRVARPFGAPATGFPSVETVHASPGLLVPRAYQEAFGIVAPSEKTAPAAIRFSCRRPDARGSPSYQRCVENAPLALGGSRPNISRADFTFCLLAIDWGSVQNRLARSPGRRTR